MDILTLIRGWFSPDLLVEIREGLLIVKSFSTDKKFEDVPLIAIEKVSGKSIVRAIGHSAKGLSGPDIKVTNPFSHSRSMFSSFMYAEKVIQHAFLSVNNSRFGVAPRVIMHQLEKNEGGLSDIEEQILRNLTAPGLR